MPGATGSGTPPAGGAAIPGLGASGLGVPHHPSLSPEQQELAARVYDKTAATASELERAFEGKLAPSAVRAALDALVAKHVLRATRGRDGTAFYVQALRQTEIQAAALTRVVEDQFGDSLANAVRLLVLLVHERQPEALDDLAAYLETAVCSPTRA